MSQHLCAFINSLSPTSTDRGPVGRPRVHNGDRSVAILKQQRGWQANNV